MVDMRTTADQTDERPDLHGKALVIDGLIVSKWGRELFEEMHRGGLTAANCTCSVWEGFEDSMRAMAQWKRWFREHGDILLQVYGVDDIRRAKAEGKVGIILGWQNSSGFGDSLDTVALYAELGLRVVQFTYSTANLAGFGCMESHDGGISDFGRELVQRLNAHRLVIDLSHVGSRTSADVVALSEQPVAYTHCAPQGLKAHSRNKTDAELRAVVDKGGMIGVTMFPPFMPRGNESTLDDYVSVIEYVINLCGESQVGIGTDFAQGMSREDMMRFLRDKGTGRQLLVPTGAVFPPDFNQISQYPNLTQALERRGWGAARIEAFLGANWMRYFADVWGH
jgi:membrane dipeptidase